MNIYAMTARTIDVRPGDAFDYGNGVACVVIQIKGNVATCRNTSDGRRTRIQVRRLQTEYRRLGSRGTASALRKLCVILREKER